MSVEDNFLEDIGVDFRGLGLPGLGPNGVEFNDFGDGSSDVRRRDRHGRPTSVRSSTRASAATTARVSKTSTTRSSAPTTSQASGGLSFQWTFLNDLQLELILRAVSKSERVETVTARPDPRQQRRSGQPLGPEPGRLRPGLRRPDRAGGIDRRPDHQRHPGRRHPRRPPGRLGGPPLPHPGAAPDDRDADASDPSTSRRRWVRRTRSRFSCRRSRSSASGRRFRSPMAARSSSAG